MKPRIPHRGDPGLAATAVDVEISAFLTRTRGLSSDGICQALADMGKDSAWFAAEVSRLYDATPEVFYKTKLLSMAADMVKQREGQRVHVDDMATASNDDMKAIEQAALKQLRIALKEGLLDASQIQAIGVDPKLLESTSNTGSGPIEQDAGRPGNAKTRKRGASEEKPGNPPAIPPAADPGRVSPE